MATQTYIKIIDADTLQICNAAGVGIIVNTANGLNSSINVAGWQAEILGTADFYFPEITADFFMVMITGYSTGFPREFVLRKNLLNNSIFYISSGAPARKNNICTAIFFQIMKTGKYWMVLGTENYKNRNLGNNNYGGSAGFSPYTMNAYNSSTVNHFQSASNGGVPYQFGFCNGSIIEIYK